MRGKMLFSDRLSFLAVFRGYRGGFPDKPVNGRTYFRVPVFPVFLILKPFLRGFWEVLFECLGFHSSKKPFKINCSGPNGSRTRVLALRGPRPRPLDDGTNLIKS
jgi:hypothetical protein